MNSAGKEQISEGLSMRKIACYVLVVASCAVFSCGTQKKYTEPDYILKKWSKAIRDLNYRAYSACEAYPRSESVFKEMYKDYYIVDLMVTDKEGVDEDDVRKDPDGKSYIRRSISFEGTIVQRKNKEPVQVLRGNAIFIKFIDGQRADDDWLISNRTFIRIDRK
jgi:hypothetical protein